MRVRAKQTSFVTEAALTATEYLPTLEELKSEPTLEELNKALDSLATGKAPGKDGIPPEVLKCVKGPLVEGQHEIPCQCRREGAVWQNIR